MPVNWLTTYQSVLANITQTTLQWCSTFLNPDAHLLPTVVFSPSPNSPHLDVNLVTPPLLLGASSSSSPSPAYVSWASEYRWLGVCLIAFLCVVAHELHRYSPLWFTYTLLSERVHPLQRRAWAQNTPLACLAALVTLVYVPLSWYVMVAPLTELVLSSRFPPGAEFIIPLLLGCEHLATYIVIFQNAPMLPLPVRAVFMLVAGVLGMYWLFGLAVGVLLLGRLLGDLTYVGFWVWEPREFVLFRGGPADTAALIGLSASLVCFALHQLPGCLGCVRRWRVFPTAKLVRTGYFVVPVREGVADQSFSAGVPGGGAEHIAPVAVRQVAHMLMPEALQDAFLLKSTVVDEPEPDVESAFL